MRHVRGKDEGVLGVRWPRRTIKAAAGGGAGGAGVCRGKGRDFELGFRGLAKDDFWFPEREARGEAREVGYRRGCGGGCTEGFEAGQDVRVFAHGPFL